MTVAVECKDKRTMKKLNFSSLLLEQGTRYSSQLILPDYLYDRDGNLDRQAMLHVLLSEEYGFVSDEGVSISVTIEKESEAQFAGKCKQILLRFDFQKNGRTASFSVNLFLPYAVQKIPMIVHLNFEDRVPNKYCPIEELMDRGVGIAHIDYRAVTSDDGDFENGLAALLSDRTDPRGAGKLAIWSYAARTVGHWLLENGYAQTDNLYVAGHSRLGKTALLTAATDADFAGALVNCSGSCGAAIAREKTGETIQLICKKFPFWFTPTFDRYAEKENELPFDQHWLAACVAPRKLCIVTAKDDVWADTDAQYLCAEATSVAYEKFGVIGFDQSGLLLKYGESNALGRIAFSKRLGTHFLSRDDWNFFIDFIQQSNL